MIPTLCHLSKCGLSTDPLNYLFLSTSLLNDPLLKPGGGQIMPLTLCTASPLGFKKLPTPLYIVGKSVINVTC